MNLGTFIYDKVVRDKYGIPKGRVILKNDQEYEQGMDAIPVVLLKMSMKSGVLGLVVYVDGEAYKIPTDIEKSKVSQKGPDFIITNFYLKREGSE